MQWDQGQLISLRVTVSISALFFFILSRASIEASSSTSGSHYATMRFLSEGVCRARELEMIFRCLLWLFLLWSCVLRSYEKVVAAMLCHCWKMLELGSSWLEIAFADLFYCFRTCIDER